ncbi:MAG: xanthine dehydrogenase family protein [Deltaproteobacteria bacterium]|nr:xanthine dehydrogenase family protein [Deltaproteobacteria bacterium]
MSRAVFGVRVERREDLPLLKGQGSYTDDLKLAGMLHTAVLRSPHARARIRSIDVSAARALPGVAAVFTHAELGVSGKEIPLLQPNPALVPRTQLLLAKDEVRYAGEPVALVVADDRYTAEDAMDLIRVEYEPLPVVSDVLAAIEDGTPLVYPEIANNLASCFTLGFGDIEAAFATSDVVLKQRFKAHRGGGHAMECRAVLAEYDRRANRITMWSATQAPHLVARLASQMLGMGEWQIRVIAPPDVGGGFGPKAIFYPEEGLIPFAARVLGRPVKWTEDRREHFLATNQERDQYHDAEIALSRDGRILGFRDTVTFDTGAYVPWGIIEPWITATTIPGPYKLPAFQVNMRVVYTNKVPVTPVRGAGRPQAVFAMERMMDLAARELRLDPAEIRRRNLIQPEEMPYKMGLVYRDGAAVTYDSGDYPACLRKAQQMVGYEAFREEQSRMRQEGRYIGVGIGLYVEGTGLGPYEGAIIKIDSSGKVLLTTGATPQGQGHATTMAQIAAHELGVDVDDVTVITGDTGAIPFGIGTFASRIAVNAGNSVLMAAREVREKALAIAASLLEADKDDLEMANGVVFVRGVPNKSISLGNLAVTAAGARPGYTLPPGVQPGLQATHYFSPSQAAYSSGAHVVTVEVDVRTGDVKILDYAVAHDCGRVINPMIVDGQVQGGVAHGIGNCFYEELVYDDNGQLLTSSFMDYLLPTAKEVPTAKIAHVEVVCPLNPLGVKGVGEGGTIPCAAAFGGAVEDALAPFGVTVTEVPLSPEKVRKLLRQAGR